MLLDEAGRIHIWSVFTGRQVKMAQLSRGPCVGVLAEGAEGPITLVCHGLTARSILTHHVDSKGKKLNLGCAPAACTAPIP